MKRTLHHISFEFFPPKTPEGMKHLQQTAKALDEFSPSFFSVTYGAGGSTRKGTIDTVAMLQQQMGMKIAPHLACMGSSRAELIELLELFMSMDIKRIVALRGDLPSGMGQTGEFKYASELVELIREVTGSHFYIEVAAYPEFHPQASSVLDDIMSLKRKWEAGANSAITQYFFNADAYFYLLDKCEKHGINIPITPGIMPITHFEKLVRFSDMCGAEIPRWLRKRLAFYGDDHESVKSLGLEVVHDLCETLIEGGAPGLHFYTLNGVEATTSLLQQLGRSTVNGTHHINAMSE